MTKTEIIALYGAIVATAGILWNFYLRYIDRGRFQVDASFGLRVAMLTGESEEYLFISVTNVGRRPIMASVIVGAWKQARETGDQFTFVPNDLPKLLKPGESHQEIYEKHVWRNILKSDLNAIWVRDAVGKKWYASKKNIKQLIEWGEVVNK